MTDNVENLILEPLRAIRDDIKELKQRLIGVETSVAGLRRDSAASYGELIQGHVRHDRLVDRIERIERRLDLRDAVPTA
ncbi:MAG: hypothetical protein KJ558_04085 [Gammaproteobacteria bacterium]|nr:hypothetical protein [Gammaproteobacteria bacterium]MBU1654003.1 hypothetical protein [Gammaproteobacteria bacterium]MBU1960738.1 hypothetical protein [Gammaproteobacteria bacterium]